MSAISSQISAIVNNDKLQNFVFIHRPDFSANVQRYIVPPLIEEKTLSQDVTEKKFDNPNITVMSQFITNEIRDSDEITIKNIDNIPAEDKKLDHKFPEFITAANAEHDEDLQPQAGGTLSKNNIKIFCTFCNNTFVNKHQLNLHMRLHDTNRKRVICPIQQCGRIYASKQSFDLHYKQTHLDEGLLCTICQKIFPGKQTLEVHMRYHTKEYPYPCNLCERKFAQKGHLTQHIEVKHQNLRYICTESGCGKTFENSVSLRNHRYKHSSMPFKCSHCIKQYPQKNKLKAHLMNAHSLKYSLDDLEEMRQFNIIRTRHAYVKVQAVESAPGTVQQTDLCDEYVDVDTSPK